jgi:hypothetical protein
MQAKFCWGVRHRLLLFRCKHVFSTLRRYQQQRAYRFKYSRVCLTLVWLITDGVAHGGSNELSAMLDQDATQPRHRNIVVVPKTASGRSHIEVHMAPVYLQDVLLTLTSL